MKKSRRIRLMVFSLTIMGLLAGPATPSDAQVVDTSDTDAPAAVEAHAVVLGHTAPPSDGFNLGVNRVAGPSRFVGTQIEAAIICNSTSVHQATLEQPPGADVDFFADDDVTDGHGEVFDPGPGGEFSGADQINAGNITAKVLGGRFHRILGFVEVDLTLDVTVTNSVGGQVCRDPALPFRLVLHLLPQTAPPAGDGFTLAGIGRRHHRLHARAFNRLVHVSISDRVSAARIGCNIVGPHSTSVDEPPIVTTTSTPIGPGNGDFHPCPATYEGVTDYVGVETSVP